MTDRPLDAAAAQLRAARDLVERTLASLEAASEIAAAPSSDPGAARLGLDAERQRADAADAEIARITAEFDTAIDELRQEHATVLREQTARHVSLPLDELLTAFAALRRSQASTDVLTALLEGISREFPRAALFAVRGNTLVGVEQHGFDSARDISKVTLPLAGDSLLPRAARSGQLESFFPGVQDAPDPATPFGAAPPSALAIPIVVRGSTIAIIYADDPDAPEFSPAVPQARAKFAELLHQQAQMVLTTLWFEERAAANAREYAAALIADLRHAHETWMQADRNPLERQHDLKVAIDRSRALYLQRIGAAGSPDVRALDELLATATRAATTFAGDLAVVLGRSTQPTRASVLTMRR